MSKEVKWGILGTADIARKFCVSVSEATNATVAAVASRDKSKAEAWVSDNCKGARAYGSYEELLEDAEIEAVYIPLPTALRPDWVEKAAAKKKHVLCEKPVASTAKDVRRVMQACKSNGVQFMDNTMFMHNGRMSAMRKVLDDPELFGTLKHVASSFSIPMATEAEWAKSNIRMKKATEPLGALGDLGWYNVYFILWAFGYENPEAISCHFMEKTDEGVPLSVLANFKFSGGRTASMDCSFKAAWRDHSEVVSEKCCLRVDDFVITAKEGVSSFTVTKGSCADKAITFPVEVIKTEDVKEKMQHTLLVEKFGSIVASGELDNSWPKNSEQVNLTLLAMVASAKLDGAWTSPRFAGKGSGKGSGKVQPPVKMKKARFGNVVKIRPEAKGLNLEVKVLSVEAVPGLTACIAVVGDESGVVNLSAKGEQVATVVENASIILRNATAQMRDSRIVLEVDKWGKIESSAEAFEFTPNKDKDVSATEYELVDK